MSKNRIGVIEKEIGAVIEPHEALAADALALNGFDVKFLKPRNTYKTKTPDITMNGIDWEIKSPTSSEKNTMKNIIHKATKQSENLIIDTIRTNMKDDHILKQLNAILLKHRSINKLVVITKVRKVIVLKGKL